MDESSQFMSELLNLTHQMIVDTLPGINSVDYKDST